jgi:sensor histidine kinase regulating citrate/malate metabolism
MQRIFSAFKQALNNLLILFSVGLLVSSLFIFAPASMAAAPISTEGQKLIQQEALDKESQAVNNREQAYEEQLEAEKDPDKVYEKNLKSYRASHPSENPIEKTVEGAEKLVEKVTGDR